MRNIGLDIARSIAIILVLLAHSQSFFLNYGTFNFLVFLGIAGVEIFFTLSGFLIGSIIIKGIIEKQSFHSLKRFYIRRWLRTLPLYYIILIIIFIKNETFVWQHLFFFQNFNETTLVFFPVSWSLSVEEWFYLLIPLLILLLSQKIKDKNRLLLFSSLLVIIGSLVLRIIFVKLNDPTWVYGVRMQPFLRLDSIMLGVLFAGIKIYYRSIYEKITKFPVMLLITSMVGISLCGYYFVTFYYEGNFDIDLFPRTLYLSILPLFSILLVVSLEKMVFNFPGLFGKIIIVISLTSYCVYLIHFDTYRIFLDISQKYSQIQYSSLLFFVLSIFTIYFLSLISYKFIEKPILKYRDKITK